MHSLTIFDDSAADDNETVALRELLDFLEKPQSIGLDNLKESLRNIVNLALEIKGYATGYALQHLVHGEHSSLAPEGILRGDKERKRKLQEFWDDIIAIEREMARSFHAVFEYTAKKIIAIKQGIIEEIIDIDAVIEEKTEALEQADTSAEEAIIAQEITRKKNKRKKLVQFKQHVKQQEAELYDANTTQEIIGIQNNVFEDVEDFKAGRFTPEEKRTNPLEVLGNVIGAATANNDSVYDVKPSITDKLGDDDDKTSGDSEASSDGKSGRRECSRNCVI